MKKIIYIPFLILIGGMASAEYTITVPLTKSGGGALPDDSIIITSDWQNSSTEYGQWTNTGEIYGCTNWSPLTSTITIGQNFTQTATDCSQNQARTAQDKEVERISGITQNKGASYIETQTITVSDTRDAVGSLETWVATTPTYTDWTNTNALYGCTNWSPSGSTKTATATFTQTAINCKTDQSRIRQDREQETTTLAYRNNGSAIIENQTLSNQTATRSYTVTLGSWTNTGGKYGCTNWSPATSTVNQGQTFTQTATDCEQNQTRSRVENYVDHKSGATVQVSSSNESKTLTNQSSTRTATGTKVAKVCQYQSDYTKALYYVLSDYYGSRTFMWNTVSQGSTTGSSVTSGGYLYTMGAHRGGEAWSGAPMYEICRQPI